MFIYFKQLQYSENKGTGVHATDNRQCDHIMYASLIISDIIRLINSAWGLNQI